MEFYRQKMWFKYRDQVVSSLYSHRKPITTHDFSSAELKTQLTFLHLSRTYVSRFAGKVDTHLCECTMKEYIYFFNIEAGDWTWNCTRLCFVESIGFFWTELAAIVMNDFLTFHKLQWFKTSLEYFMTNNRCSNDVAAFAKLSHVCTYSRRRHVSGSSELRGRISCRFLKSDSLGKITALTLPNGLCMHMLEKTTLKLTSFIIIDSLFTTCSGRFFTRTWSVLIGTMPFIQEFNFEVRKSSRMLELSV